jgi:hypothetical protein
VQLILQIVAPEASPHLINVQPLVKFSIALWRSFSYYFLPKGVAYHEYFKKHCPQAYTYAYDDASALKTCDSKLKADYTLTFCPPH